ncbi:hypothetical protein RVS70_05530 [Virgibacillus sp. M23]|uniref:hypothetical protein n=1 Tax=Virgibacillus sp. M23 TaxID=3079030 RepID=UPI002A91B007|nr:hypothetical protein [Virgibacillus sp. M23]MDY7043663.1 hypothetical protein [Virgibacillus sp. M23]
MDKKKSVKKKSISLREDVHDIAVHMADKYFGGNLSAYITFLICSDKYGLSRVSDNGEKQAVKEDIKENWYTKSDANDSFIDDIVNM